MKAIVWEGDDKGAKFHEEEIPADLVDKAAEFRAPMIEAAVEMDDDALGAYLDGKEPDVATLKQLHPQGDGHARLLPDAVRLGLQEQGRAAAARRRRRLSCPRPPIARPTRASTSRPAKPTDAQAAR